MPRVVCVWLNSPMLVSSKEATDGDSPLCSGEWSEVPSFARDVPGPLPSRRSKGFNSPCYYPKNLSEPQERQDSYLCLFQQCILNSSGSRVRERTLAWGLPLATLGLSEDLYPLSASVSPASQFYGVLRGKTVNPPGDLFIDTAVFCQHISGAESAVPVQHFGSFCAMLFQSCQPASGG